MIEILGRKRKKRSYEIDEERRRRQAESSALMADHKKLLQHATPEELAALDRWSDELSNGRRRRQLFARIRERVKRHS